MRKIRPIDAAQMCEEILLEGRRYNIEHQIFPSEIAVADRLLARSLELGEAYQELYDKLHRHPYALKTFFGLLLSTSAFWNPKKITQARSGRARLQGVNQQIASKAAELATLLDERSDLHDHSGFADSTYYHVCEVVEAAAKGNYLFGSYVQKELQALRRRFDLKYWPTLGDFLQALATDAEEASMEATDPLTAAATLAVRSSRADFFKALFVAIEENRTGSHGFLPHAFKLTDNALASLANCALGLGPDDPVDGAYVKRLRQREREATKYGRRRAATGKKGDT